MLIQGSEKHLLRKLSKTIPMVEPHYWQKYFFTSVFLGSFQSFPVQSFCTTLVNGWLLPFRFVKIWKNQLFNDKFIRNSQIVFFPILTFYLLSIFNRNIRGEKDIAAIPLASSSVICKIFISVVTDIQ